MSDIRCALCGHPIGDHFCGSKRRRPTQEELQPLIDEYESGVPIRVMAERHGVDYSLMRRRLRWGGAKIRNGYPRTPSRWDGK
jgi:DNA-directed RNA polymerase subunit N (RpoN/RPB10)